MENGYDPIINYPSDAAVQQAYNDGYRQGQKDARLRTELGLELYTQTVKRLARGGIKDPTSQIIALAEEIERYRAKIRYLEEAVKNAKV